MKFIDLAGFAPTEISRACTNLGISAGGRMDQQISGLIAGGFTLAQVQAAMSAPMTPAGVSASVGSEIATAVAAAEGRILTVLSGKADAAVVATISAETAALAKGLSTVAGKKAAAVNVDAAVAAAVSAAFKPLRAAFDAAPAEVQDRIVAVVPRERQSVAAVFDMPGEAGDVEVWGQRGEVDADYIFNPTLLRMALKALELGDNFWLFGEKGTGKTQFAIQLAARTGRKIFRVSLDKTMERLDFIGSGGVENGNTIGVWQDGVILKAMRTPGAICLLDEIARGKPEYLVVLNPLLEPQGTYTIPITGEVVSRAPGMVFIAADNTSGNGDETSRYPGANQMDSSLLDRFALSEEVLFLPRQQEVDLLIRKGADSVLAGKLIDMINVCRAKVGAVDGPVEPPSLRQAMAFCRYYGSDTDAMVFKRTIINKSSSMSAEALLQIFTSQWEA